MNKAAKWERLLALLVAYLLVDGEDKTLWPKISTAAGKVMEREEWVDLVSAATQEMIERVRFKDPAIPVFYARLTKDLRSLKEKYSERG